MPEKRKEYIIRQIRSNVNVKVSELADQCKVTEPTIRRDLQELEDLGMLIRTHGGATLKTNARYEATFAEKEQKHWQEKYQIALKAVSLIKEEDTIALDAGTTTFEIAKLLIDYTHITVVTNSINIANLLAPYENIDLIVIGGSVRWNTQTMVGPFAETMLSSINVDKTFLGTNALSFSQGISTPTIVEARGKQCLLAIANKKIVVCDSSKINKVSFAKVCDIEDIDILITDSGLYETSLYEQLKTVSTEVVVAKQ